MKKRPFLYLVLGVFFLIVPPVIYLCFLVPQLKEEYNVLLASGGVLGGFGYYGASKIPDKIKYGGVFKTAARAYTTVVLSTLVQEFLPKILIFIAILVTSFIIYLISKELYKNGKRKLENKELAEQISRGFAENIK